MKITIHCAFCEDTHTQEIKVPSGWSTYTGVMEEENGLCPKHAAIDDFASLQCPGCVGGWGDCGLWRSFAYGKCELSESDFASIRSGKCPKRVNGSFSFDSNGIRDIDLSRQPSTESGLALADAIVEYGQKYYNQK